MTRKGENDNKPKKPGGRGERLAAALRDNLKRRKAQMKARAQAAAQSERGEKTEPEPRKDKGG